MSHAALEFKPLNVAVLTVSDTRTAETDSSGLLLVDALQGAGHRLADKQIVIDDIYQIRAVLSQWIASPQIQAVIITGGTGFVGTWLLHGVAALNRRGANIRVSALTRDPAAFTLLPSDHEAVAALLGAVGYVDVVIPRGGAGRSL